jgi:hypothetical protein
LYFDLKKHYRITEETPTQTHCFQILKVTLVQIYFEWEYQYHICCYLKSYKSYVLGKVSSSFITSNSIELSVGRIKCVPVKQFEFANTFDFHVNQHRGYMTRQSCSHCQRASKHIINPVEAWEAHCSYLRKLQKREKTTGGHIFSQV